MGTCVIRRLRQLFPHSPPLEHVPGQRVDSCLPANHEGHLVCVRWGTVAEMGGRIVGFSPQKFLGSVLWQYVEAQHARAMRSET